MTTKWASPRRYRPRRREGDKMIYTTFALAHQAGACTDSYRKLARALGGIEKYGANTPIPLDQIIEVLGLNDAIWAMRCTTTPAENVMIEFSCRCAEHVLVHFEAFYPEDQRPRQAIDAARRCITDKSADWAAWAAAWAAWDASADWAAEKQWQTGILLSLLQED